ncbi:MULTISPECIES: hypothetical protein [unclassified Bradyrhizobium]
MEAFVVRAGWSCPEPNLSYRPPSGKAARTANTFARSVNQFTAFGSKSIHYLVERGTGDCADRKRSVIVARSDLGIH